MGEDSYTQVANFSHSCMFKEIYGSFDFRPNGVFF